MGDRSESDYGFTAYHRGEKLSREQVEYLLSLMRKAGLDVDELLSKILEKKQVVNFEDELTLEVYNKKGELKEKKIVK